MPAAMADERLELRPNWLTLAGLLYVTAMGFLVATTVCLTSKQEMRPATGICLCSVRRVPTWSERWTAG